MENVCFQIVTVVELFGNINYSFNIEIYFCEPSLGREIQYCLPNLHHRTDFLLILIKGCGISLLYEIIRQNFQLFTVNIYFLSSAERCL